ncbi:MAG TPA: hypothetical protein VH763_02165 [Gemmatimonadales bacterium]|jgi:hypothetical protein
MAPAHFTFELDPKARLVRIAGSGDPQYPEWIALFDQVLASPGFQPGTDFLIDRRGMDSIPSNQTVEEMIDYYADHREQLGHCRLASVTTNSAVYGMTRMAEVFAERTTVTVRVFRDMESAYRWLRPDERSPEA